MPCQAVVQVVIFTQPTLGRRIGTTDGSSADDRDVAIRWRSSHRLWPSTRHWAARRVPRCLVPAST